MGGSILLFVTYATICSRVWKLLLVKYRICNSASRQVGFSLIVGLWYFRKRLRMAWNRISYYSKIFSSLHNVTQCSSINNRFDLLQYFRGTNAQVQNTFDSFHGWFSVYIIRVSCSQPRSSVPSPWPLKNERKSMTTALPESRANSSGRCLCIALLFTRPRLAMRSYWILHAPYLSSEKIKKFAIPVSSH